MYHVNNERERNILGEEEDQIGREPIRWRRRRKEKKKEKKEERKEKEKEKEKQKGGIVRESEGKKETARGGKKEKGMALPFAISGEPAIKTCLGKRQSWSTQRKLCMGTEIQIFRRSSKR